MASNLPAQPAGIGLEEVRVTAAMARLHVDEAELGRLTGELSRILEFAARLSEVDVTGVEPMTHAVPMSCPLREDRVDAQGSDDTGSALRNAPATDSSFFVVPAILHAGSDGSEG